MMNSTNTSETGNLIFERLKQCYLTGGPTEYYPAYANLTFTRHMAGLYKIIRCFYFSTTPSDLTIFEERQRNGRYEQVIYDYREENASGNDCNTVLLNACKKLWPMAIVVKAN